MATRIAVIQGRPPTGVVCAARRCLHPDEDRVGIVSVESDSGVREYHEVCFWVVVIERLREDRFRDSLTS